MAAKVKAGFDIDKSVFPPKPHAENITAHFSEHDVPYCAGALHFKRHTFVSLQHSVSPEKSHFSKSLTKADPWELSPFSPLDIQTPEWRG